MIRLYLAYHGYVQIEGPRSTFLFSEWTCTLAVSGLHIRFRLVYVHILFLSGEKQTGSKGQTKRLNFFNVEGSGLIRVQDAGEQDGKYLIITGLIYTCILFRAQKLTEKIFLYKYTT